MSTFIYLQKERERSLLRRHPWVFSKAIENVKGKVAPGAPVEIFSNDGRWLARGAWSPESQIRARVWTFDCDQSIDHAFIKRAVAASVARRAAHPWLAKQDGVRLIHGESDGLPGVIADRFGPVVVVQLSTAGAEKWRDAIVAGLIQATGCSAVYERSDSDVRRLEGLGPQSGIVYGELPELLTIVENGVKMEVDVVSGHKTGFYLDQRENRELVKRYSKGRTVLNTFCYTGGFSVYAMAGGAEKVCSVDSSERAVVLATENMKLNFGPQANFTETAADAVEYLKNIEDKYDLIILDPPAFAKHHKVLGNAMQGYKRLNARAISQIRPGGILFTFSCSQAVSKELFRTMIFSAAAIAGRNVRILHQLTQPADHPVSIYHPEGEYLKGLVLYVE